MKRCARCGRTADMTTGTVDLCAVHALQLVLARQSADGRVFDLGDDELEWRALDYLDERLAESPATPVEVAA